jgi:hypothetical protein
MNAADRFDEMFSGRSLAEEFGSVPDPDDAPDSVSAKIMVALEFVLELQKKGLSNDFGCVSWSEKDGLNLTVPCPRIPFEQDSESDTSESSVLDDAYKDAISRVSAAQCDSATKHEHRTDELLAELIFQIKVLQTCLVGIEFRAINESQLRAGEAACSSPSDSGPASNDSPPPSQ